MKKILSLIFVLVSIVSYGQKLDRFSTELPSLTVNQIAIDGNIVYAATANGLVKYDGTNWTVYTSANTSNGLPSNNVLSVAFDNDVLYAGTANNLSWFDGSTWNKATLTGNVVNIAPEPSLQTYVTSNNGLHRFNTSTDLTLLDNNTTIKKGLISYYNGLDKHVWYLVGNTLKHYDVKNNAFSTVNLGGTASHLIYESGFIYYTTTTGLAKYEISTNTPTNLYPNNGTYNYVTKDIDGNFWLAYKTNSIDKIKRWNPNTNVATQEINIGSTINDIKADANGYLWVATNNGLYKYDHDAIPEVTVTNTTLEAVPIETATYQWYFSTNSSTAKLSANAKLMVGGDFQPISGATTNSVTATQTGYYVVEITENGTTVESDPQYIQLTTTSTLDAATAARIVMYPNPSNGRFSIKGEEVIEVVVTNMNGQSESFTLSGFGDEEIYTNLKGILVVTIVTPKGSTNKKIVVQ